MDLARIFDVAEFEALAANVMDPDAFAYYVGGAEREITVAANERAYDAFRFRPRVLRGLAAADTTTSMLGAEVQSPIGLAPAALQRLCHHEGEAAAARAAGKMGVLQVAATESSCSLEEIAEAGPGPKWFQLYVHSDRTVAEDLIKRADAAGYLAIVLTVDLTVPGYRTREYRHNFTPPADVGPGNYQPAAKGLPMAERIAAQYGDGLRWSDIDWVRARTDLPVVLKGIMTAEDAALAVEHGADAIVVSNHGGRQLDRSQASIEILGEVIEAVEGQIEVYVDGGIRRGTDVLIALALGARAVFIGRPYLWGLAVAGEEGVTRVLEIMQTQLTNGMLNLGVGNLTEISREHLA